MTCMRETVLMDDLRETEAKEFGKGLVKLEGLGNLISICMAVVMRELDSCLSSNTWFE